MSHHTDESGTVPDDHLLVRPYVAPSGRASRSAGHARPRTEPATDPRPHSGDEAASGHTPAWYGEDPAPSVPRAPAPPPVVEPAPLPVARERAGWLPVAALALLGLAVAGGLVYLTAGPEPESPRVAPPSGLSVPVLPARSPDAGPDAGGAEPSASPAVPSSSASASSAAGRGAERPSTSPGRGATPTAAPSSSRPPAEAPGDGASATLRPGDRGPEVRALQERLHGQGFTYVSTTGMYDEQTRRGVAQLQGDRSITGDPRGVYGPATRAAFD
ncbi:peptidoglycan-binding domain-containing protein [Streptomyces sp. CA-243310]|uniref:peptidoglycan-binding domain-containing protein n=1 Tax=Streptomyces sp. CA-243310 TaxID=3240056 RepID=UPI003D90F3C4